MASKIWKIKGYQGIFTDEQIISLIRSGKLTGNDALTSKDIKTYIMIKDSIYQYYLKKEDNYETI